MAVDPYAPPTSRVSSAPLSTTAVRRDGDLLVIDIDGGDSLPAVCVKCGQPAHGARLTRTLQYHPPWVYLLLFFNVIIYAIGAFFTRKRMQVAIPLCDAHRSGRRGRLFAAAGIMGVATLGCMGGVAVGDDAGAAAALVGGVVGLVGLIMLMVSLSPLKPKIINDFEGRFKGADAAFLDQLPSA